MGGNTVLLGNMVDSRYTDGETADVAAEDHFETYHDDVAPEDAESPLLSSEEADTRKAWTDRMNDRVPPRLIRYWKATVTWVKGPKPPRIFSITPILPGVQHAPLNLLDRLAPKRAHKVCLLIAFYLSWALAFGLIMWKSSFASDVPGYGAPTRLWCGATFW